MPRYVLVADFARFRLFGFIAGYQTRSFGQEDPVNAKAAEQLGQLHDQLKASGYEGHALEIFLVRVLFCLFAEDTAIFERRQFQDYLEDRTAEDGSDLGMHLAQLWQAGSTTARMRIAGEKCLPANSTTCGISDEGGSPPRPRLENSSQAHHTVTIRNAAAR